MQLKLQFYSKVCQIALLFTGGLVIAGVIFPTLDVLYEPGLAKHKRDALKLAWLHWFARILCLNVNKVGNLADNANLLVSNHISWLDIIVLGSFSPAHFVAKSDISAWPIIGYLAKQGGTIFVRRENKQQSKVIAETLVWLLKQNNKVIAFPEGTTTNGEKVLPFHSSLFQSAVLTRATVQPISIQYLGVSQRYAPFIGEDDFVSHLIKILSLDKIEIRVEFLPVIKTTGKTRQSISNEARDMILECLLKDNDQVPLVSMVN